MADAVKKKPVVKAVIFGLLSIILYYLLITKQDLYMPYFSKGGFYSLLIIGTAFIFPMFMAILPITFGRF
jgi:hypothetical protein